MVLLPWTPPYDWAWMVGFLQARAVAGVERFHDGGYSRSFGVEGHRGLIHLAPDEEAQGLRVSLSPGLQPVAEICYARIGQLFDLACDPRQVARTLGDLAQRMAARIEKVPGARDVLTQASDSVEYLQVKVDAQAAGRAGLAVTQVQDELRAQLEGVPAGLVIEPDRRTPIVVRGDARLRGSAERFKDLQLARGDQGEIPLTSLARIATTDGPVLVRRENGSRLAPLPHRGGGGIWSAS